MVTAERQSGGGATTTTPTTTTSAQQPATQQPAKGQKGGESLLSPTTASSSLIARPLPLVRAPFHPQEPPARHAPGQVVRRRQGRRMARKWWREPMTAAVLVGTSLVVMLCVYLYAYARVTAAGFQASQTRRALVKARQEEQNLHARISGLLLPGTVASRAKSLGMEMAAPEDTQVLSTSETDAPMRQP